VLNLDALANTPLRSDPFEWSLTEDAVDRRDAERLATGFPDEDFWELSDSDGEKSWSYAARPLITLGADHIADLAPLDDSWNEIAHDLLSADYRDALAKHIGRSMDGALFEASIWRWGGGGYLGPHLDLPSKLATQVYYLNDPAWDPDWGGCLRILDSRDENDMAAELPPVIGTASTLVRSDNSWHSVTAIRDDAPAPRRNLIVTWFHPGSTSPVWAVDESGEISCPAGGVREPAAH
jgi:SM-20-related protein